MVGLITPWNWPINQIVCKVAPAIAAGCTMVLKPSEVAPLNAIIWSEVMHAAGVPAGVYNMVQGEGGVVGAAMSAHPDIDMMSFTGSTRAGILVAQAAAQTVKRVAQELGGKSANILLPDVDFQTAVTKGVLGMMGNSGQSCSAPTRMFVPADRHEEVKAIAKAAAESRGRRRRARSTRTNLGPVVSEVQFNKIQRLIQAGIDEGAELVTGGPGPAGAPQSRLLRAPDGVCRCAQRHDHRARGNLRPGACRFCHIRTRRRRCGLPTTRFMAWQPMCSRAISHHARKRGGRDARGQCPCELPGRRHGRAVRRLQAVRQRPRIRQMGAGRVPRDQGCHRLRDRLSATQKPRWTLSTGVFNSGIGR